jgi:carbon monoxide dehydrogenase subunit G
MELEVQRHERINAPLQLVWEEIDSLDQILAKTPQISEYDVIPGGQKARGKTKLTWGPVKWAVDVDVALTDFVPRQHVTFVIEAHSLETRGEVTVAIASIGEGETKLNYRCTLEVRHRMASRMRGLFTEILEDQAHSILHRVKVKSEQRRLAQERLLK